MAEGVESLKEVHFMFDGAAARERVADMIESAQLFNGWTRQEVESVAHYGKAFTAAADKTIVEEGDRGRMICILIEGKIDVYKDDETGQRKRVSTIRKGKAFGEMSIIDEMPHSASAVTVEPVTLIVVPGDQFDKLVHDLPRVANKLLWTLAKLISMRLRQTTGTLVDLL